MGCERLSHPIVVTIRSLAFYLNALQTIITSIIDKNVYNFRFACIITYYQSHSICPNLRSSNSVLLWNRLQNKIRLLDRLCIADECFVFPATQGREWPLTKERERENRKKLGYWWCQWLSSVHWPRLTHHQFNHASKFIVKYLYVISFMVHCCSCQT